MENVFDISELIRRKQLAAAQSCDRRQGVGYTCSKTGVVFPPIQCFQLPQGVAKGDAVVFDGTHVPHYQLSTEVGPANAEMMGIAQAPCVEVSCLGRDAEVAIEVFHFPNEEQAEGFFKAATHFLGDFDEIESFANDQGYFFLITTQGSVVKKGVISYITFHRAFVAALDEEVDVRVVASVDAEGNFLEVVG
ncbi:hypothetical protein [Pseudomonas viridiflava]|uniref:hypothetical protein n=1 Tax=Pseudomonas viridiflava TaxID=33069 RepID=UPI000F03D353|nr:hypothetical protein [Pseudomonas viridiflava]